MLLFHTSLHYVQISENLWVFFSFQEIQRDLHNFFWNIAESRENNDLFFFSLEHMCVYKQFNPLVFLIYFMLRVSFYTTWKNQRIRGFPMFLGAIERVQRHEIKRPCLQVKKPSIIFTGFWRIQVPRLWLKSSDSRLQLKSSVSTN